MLSVLLQASSLSREVKTPVIVIVKLSLWPEQDVENSKDDKEVGTDLNRSDP